MTLADGIRIWFINLYVLNVAVFLILAMRFRPKLSAIEKKHGPLPTPGALVTWGIPLVVLLTTVGEIPERWLAVRIAGLGLTVYNVAMQVWSLPALGRFFVPGAAVFQDHQLVTSGAFRFVRHPIYSAHVALWLGAALGTLNWLLLALWPFYVLSIVLVPIRQEERLLREKFGAAYDAYAARTGPLFPKL